MNRKLELAKTQVPCKRPIQFGLATLIWTIVMAAVVLALGRLDIRFALIAGFSASIVAGYGAFRLSFRYTLVLLLASILLFSLFAWTIPCIQRSRN